MGNYKYKKAIVDLETTDLISPGIVQCSILLLGDDDLLIGYYNRYFLNDRPFDAKASEINGLTAEILAELTEERFKDHAGLISNILADCEKIYAHNASFDIKRVLNTHFAALGIQTIDMSRTQCTMHSYTNICKIPPKEGSKYQYKTPSLIEAVDYLESCGKISLAEIKKDYKYAFGCEPENHDGLYDTYLCYQLVKNLG